MADMTPLIEQTVARGGHVRTGLEDVPLGSKRGVDDEPACPME